MEAPDSYDFSDIVQMRTQEAFKFQAPKKNQRKKTNSNDCWSNRQKSAMEMDEMKEKHHIHMKWIKLEMKKEKKSNKTKLNEPNCEWSAK